jgi:hypothetical protein
MTASEHAGVAAFTPVLPSCAAASPGQPHLGANRPICSVRYPGNGTKCAWSLLGVTGCPPVTVHTPGRNSGVHQKLGSIQLLLDSTGGVRTHDLRIKSHTNRAPFDCADGARVRWIRLACPHICAVRDRFRDKNVGDGLRRLRDAHPISCERTHLAMATPASSPRRETTSTGCDGGVGSAEPSASGSFRNRHPGRECRVGDNPEVSSDVRGPRRGATARRALRRCGRSPGFGHVVVARSSTNALARRLRPGLAVA